MKPKLTDHVRRTFGDGDRCSHCHQVLPEQQAPPWTEEEFYRARALEHTGRNQQHMWLVVHSPEGEGAVVISDETREHAGERAPVKDAERIWLTPDEAVWLYLQLDELLNRSPTIAVTNADDPRGSR